MITHDPGPAEWMNTHPSNALGLRTPAVESLCLRTMALLPEDRPPDGTTLAREIAALREGKKKEDADGGGGGEPATVAKLNRFATRAATVAIGLIWVSFVIQIVFGYRTNDITLPVIAGLLLMSFVATFPDTADAAHWCWRPGAWRVVMPARIHRTRGKIVGAAVGSYTIFLTLK